MKVAGIDFSSLAIDVVLVDVDDVEPPVWHRHSLIGQDAFDRTRSVRLVMPVGTWWDDVLAVGIEHPAGKFGVGAMMRVQGAVLACLPSTVMVKAWPPGAWRKAVGLPGNASKEDVAMFVLKDGRYPLHPTDATLRVWPQDAFDAMCIALATRQALEQVAA